MRLSYTDIFQHNTTYQGHGCLFHSMIWILKVERETFCWRDGIRIVSRETSFAHKQAGKTWLVFYFFWLCCSRASTMSIECIWKRFTLWISKNVLIFTNMFWVWKCFGFENVLNQLKELLMQNFVFFWVKGE